MKFSLSKLLTLISILVLVSSCGDDRKITISGKNAFDYVQKQVDFGHRISGSKEIKACADWLKKEIESFGVAVEIISWEEKVYGKSVTFYNVKATLPGNDDPRIIIGSHFDLKDLPGFEGANDSGSSTGVLLEMIRVLKNANLDLPTLEFYFFDGEECVENYTDEDGLHGSKYAASKLKASDYQLMLLLDMIGDLDLNITLSLDTSDDLAELALSSAKDIGFKGKIGVDPDLLILDDHVPFRDLGIPSINLIDFDFGPKNGHWHTVEDSMDKISVQSLQEAGDLALEMILQQAKQGKTSGK
ncbi:MAG: M28 family peptidase [Lentisphaeria bacterium]|nr:M28 family peptidase [Lentisphaeria bacterium]